LENTNETYTNSEVCTVKEVLSGDSIVCKIENKPREIKLLVVQSPEQSDGKKHCFADKSTKCLEELTLNKEVRLDYDCDKLRLDKSNRRMLSCLQCNTL